MNAEFIPKDSDLKYYQEAIRKYGKGLVLDSIKKKINNFIELNNEPELVEWVDFKIKYNINIYRYFKNETETN